MQSEFISIIEASELLGISRAHFTRFLLPKIGVRVGERWLIPRERLTVEYIQKCGGLNEQS